MQQFFKMGHESAALAMMCVLLVVILRCQCDVQVIEFKNVENRKTSWFTRSPVVETTSGVVVGISNDLAHAFYEIPYAEPPVGNLRFQEPQPLNSPLPEINATFSTFLKCPQNTNPYTLDNPDPVNMKEDCLVLNVFVPAHVNLTRDKPPDDRLPVMFYIHGGYYKFNAGTESRTNGEKLADAVNCIVVVINYRLGALGFLSHIENGKPDIVGNQGLKDQLLALHWVQDNIEKFGGKKSQIMLFGNSAGAQSVLFHTIWKKSESLFSHSIQQSNPNIFSLRYFDFDESLLISEMLVRAVGCNTADSERQCLLELPAQDIIDQISSVEAEVTEYYGGDIMRLDETFNPIIDGTEFTDQPVNLYRDGTWRTNKPMIIGINTEEMDERRFSYPTDEKFDKDDFIDISVNMFGEEIGLAAVEKYVEAYPPEIGEDYRRTYYKAFSQNGFDCPSRLMARYAANTTTSSVYYYVNSHPVLIDECVKQNDGNKTGCYLSSHSSEVPYVFRTINESSEEFTDSDRIVENEFSTYWGSFARTGDPSNGIEKVLGVFPDWPVYSANRTHGNGIPWVYMHIQAPTSKVDFGHLEEICDFWDEVNYGITDGAALIQDQFWLIATCCTAWFAISF